MHLIGHPVVEIQLENSCTIHGIAFQENVNFDVAMYVHILPALRVPFLQLIQLKCRLDREKWPEDARLLELTLFVVSSAL